MNYTLQNIVSLLVFLFAVFFGIYYFVLRQQGQYVPETWGELGCMRPVYIQSDSLQPTLLKGTYLSLNQCVESKVNFQTESIVYFNDGQQKGLGIVEQRKGGIYTIKIDKEESIEVKGEDIIAYTTLPSEY